MQPEMFNEFTPYDRLMLLDQRVQLLEKNLVQMVEAINTQHRHLEELNKGIAALHRYILETTQ